MELKKLFTEDRAVSPVIAVVLMIAVTVILAAVVAAFALGLSAGEPPPQVNLDFAWDDDAGQLVITHAGGDPVEAEAVSVLVDGKRAGSEDFWPDPTITTGDRWKSDETLDPSDPQSIDPGDEVRVVWRGDGGQSVTLGVYVVPS
jgi:flagellin-like protein